jgi:DNA-binding transcriptional ArsR family regulator
MPRRGPEKETTSNDVHQLMKASKRPVWSASTLADQIGVSRPTATARLKELYQEDLIHKIDVGNTTAYYIPEDEDTSKNLDIFEEHKESLVREFEDRFVGLPTAPWTPIDPGYLAKPDGTDDAVDDLPLAGNKVQIRVTGTPGNWEEEWTEAWEDRDEGFLYGETSTSETQALVSGTLYSKPTVPIEHIDYPDDHDLEANINAKLKITADDVTLVATGAKNYLIRPSNNAVFLQDVRVDSLSPIGYGQDSEQYNLAPITSDSPDKEFIDAILTVTSPEQIDEVWVKTLASYDRFTLDEHSIEKLIDNSDVPVSSKEDVYDLLNDIGSSTNNNAT